MSKCRMLLFSVRNAGWTVFLHVPHKLLQLYDPIKDLEINHEMYRKVRRDSSRAKLIERKAASSPISPVVFRFLSPFVRERTNGLRSAAHGSATFRRCRNYTPRMRHGAVCNSGDSDPNMRTTYRRRHITHGALYREYFAQGEFSAGPFERRRRVPLADRARETLPRVLMTGERRLRSSTRDSH